MTNMQRKVLVTGCSDGGLGAALCIELKKRGCHVYATARSEKKMNEVREAGCECFLLDVTLPESIAACAAQVPSLDILINNAGGGHNMPVSDLSIAKAKDLFEMNVWGPVAVSQAFIPLLKQSKGMIVNHTSVASVVCFPFQSSYSASKAAMSMFSQAMRMELAMFGIRVVELKSGGVVSNFLENSWGNHPGVPAGSLYEPAREKVDGSLRGECYRSTGAKGMPAGVWAKRVADDLLKKKPHVNSWRGMGATATRFIKRVPSGWMDGPMKKLVWLDIIEKEYNVQRNQGTRLEDSHVDTIEVSLNKSHVEE